MSSSFSQVIKNLKKFPGIGQKSAERITFYFLETDRQEIKQFILSLNHLIEKTIFCNTCGLISEQSPCRICSSSKRNNSIICVVKNIQDAIQIERSQSYQGIYHVLGGLLSPLSNVYEKDLKIDKLLKRISIPKHNNLKSNNQTIKEIIFAFEQSIEADATIQLISQKIQLLKYTEKIIFSRMAVGIPIGTGLEFIDQKTLKQSLDNRYSLNQS